MQFQNKLGQMVDTETAPLVDVTESFVYFTNKLVEKILLNFDAPYILSQVYIPESTKFQTLRDLRFQIQLRSKYQAKISYSHGNVWYEDATAEEINEVLKIILSDVEFNVYTRISGTTLRYESMSVEYMIGAFCTRVQYAALQHANGDLNEAMKFCGNMYSGLFLTTVDSHYNDFYGACCRRLSGVKK